MARTRGLPSPLGLLGRGLCIPVHRTVFRGIAAVPDLNIDMRFARNDAGEAA